MDVRQLFLRHVAQTSPSPLGIEIARAEGLYLYDPSGKAYMDLIGGISVCNAGHRHPRIVQAIKDQADRYLHVLVYGELIQSPQVRYAALLAANLPASLNSIYFTNSGAEATEGAMKLAKRVTGRTEIIAFNQSYHGSTQGALSIMGDEYWRNAYRPLLPGVRHVQYNEMSSLDRITGQTACVIAETVQAERGVYAPGAEWMKALRQRCDETGALLVLDEIQAGFGRTGKLWGFEHYDIVPDIFAVGQGPGWGHAYGGLYSRQRADVVPDGRPRAGAYHHLWWSSRLLCGGNGRTGSAAGRRVDRGSDKEGSLVPAAAGASFDPGHTQLRTAHGRGIRQLWDQQKGHRQMH